MFKFAKPLLSSSLLAALDTEIEIHDKTITSKKQRDWDEGEPIGFALESVSIGEDEDGDAVTSCAVVPAPTDARRKWKPTGQTLDAWESLCNLSPSNAPVGDKDWRAAFVKAAWPIEPPYADAQRKGFNRAIKALVSTGWVHKTEEGWQRAPTGGTND